MTPATGGRPGELRFASIVLHIRRLDAQAYEELIASLKEMEDYHKDRLVDAPDDNSTFTAKGIARGIKAIRQAMVDAVRHAANTRPGA